MEFKEKLKNLRNEKGVSQQTLADSIMISRSAVAKWENGLSLPNEQSLVLLAQYFGIDKSFLIGDESIENALVGKNQQIFKLTKIVIAVLAVACALAIAVVGVLIAYIIGVKGANTGGADMGGFGDILPQKREYVMEIVDNDELLFFTKEENGSFTLKDVSLNARVYFRIYENLSGKQVNVGNISNIHERNWYSYSDGDKIYIATALTAIYDIALTEEIIDGYLYAVHVVLS